MSRGTLTVTTVALLCLGVAAEDVQRCAVPRQENP
jgi:hypothetical protein